MRGNGKGLVAPRDKKWSLKITAYILEEAEHIEPGVQQARRDGEKGT